MERIVVSKTGIHDIIRSICRFSVFILVGMGCVLLMLGVKNLREYLHLILYPLGFFVLYLSHALSVLIGLYVGKFYIGHDGVGTKLPFRKMRFIPWEEIKEYGVFGFNKFPVAYFAAGKVPKKCQHGFYEWDWRRTTDWMAFAEFDRNFIEKAFPYLPDNMADAMRKYARLEGLESFD